MDFHDVIRKISEIYCVDAVDMRILTAIANNSLFAIRNYDCNLQPTKDICRHHFAHVIDRQNLFFVDGDMISLFPGTWESKFGRYDDSCFTFHASPSCFVCTSYVVSNIFWIPPKHQQQRPSTFFYKLNYVCGLFVSEQFQVKRNNIH